MRFFFDESGDFAVPTSDEHKCSIVCGVVLPEIVEEPLLKEFATFTSKLPDTEKDRGEPKGRLLTDNNRRCFCDLLSNYPEVLVTPTILDLTLGSGDKTNNICDNLKTRLFEDAKKCVYDTMREQVQELGKQWGNLNINEGLRLLSLTSCFWEAIEHSVVLLSEKKYFSCWEALHFIVDAVRTKRLSRDERVFEIMVLMWLTAWSKRRPLPTIKEIHTDEHPFEKNYGIDGNRFDLGKMLRGNIRFCSSSDSLGLQMADICANIIYQAVHDLDNYNSRLSIFRLLMRNCPYGPARGGPGLIHIDKSRSRIPAEKYRLLYQVMHSKNRDR